MDWYLFIFSIKITSHLNMEPWFLLIESVSDEIEWEMRLSCISNAEIIKDQRIIFPIIITAFLAEIFENCVSSRC